MSKNKTKLIGLIREVLNNYREIESYDILHFFDNFNEKSKLEQEKSLILHSIWLSPWTVSQLNKLHNSQLLAHIRAIFSIHAFCLEINLDGELIENWSKNNEHELIHLSKKNKINYLKYRLKKGKITKEKYLKELIK